MQKEQNMEWIWNPAWQFEKGAYKAIIQQYQKLKTANSICRGIDVDVRTINYHIK